jgi:hypothetical protein
MLTSDMMLTSIGSDICFVQITVSSNVFRVEFGKNSEKNQIKHHGRT